MQAILNNISTIVSVILIVLYVATFIMLAVKKVIKSKSENADTSVMDSIYDSMLSCIESAESIYNGMAAAGMCKDSTANLKLNYVLDKIRILCYDNNVKYDSTYWEKEIDKIIDVTKNVNSDSSENSQTPVNQATIKNTF